MDFIDLKTQYQRIEAEVQAKIQHVFSHGQFIMGPEVAELEKALADFVGIEHCVAVASGTDALLMALMTLDIGFGDEVITTPFSFIATAEVIHLLGAKPVYVDIDPLTYNIDPIAIERAIGPSTKAILPVSLYGQCADMDAINALAEKHGLPVIEDAAQSFGATFGGKRSCGLSTLGCTSFFPSKPLGGYGDGGAIFTPESSLAKALRELRVHGQERRYHHTRVGINGRMDTVQAAALLPKLSIFEDELERRTRVASRYSELMKEYCPDMKTPFTADGRSSVFAQYTVEVENREAVQNELKVRGIPTAVHYPTLLPHQPALKAHQSGCWPVAGNAAGRVLSLPMHPYLAEEDQDRVVAALKESLDAVRCRGAS